MSNTEIIPGMTEVMDYIKKQEEEIKDLNNRLMTCKMSIAIRDTEIKELKEHLECEEDGYPTSDWFKDKLDFHIKYHFLNEGGEYYENLKDLKEKPNCLDDLIYGSLERLQEELKEKEETFKYQSDMEKQCHNDDIDKKQQVIDELQEEIEKLHKTINTMACSSATTDWCMECWIIHEQIDPKLLLGNWEEFYVKDENGKWIKKPKKNILSERKKQKKKKKKKEFDYGESDDWVWGYGFQEKSSEYVINISGGGDGVSPNGFEDWVIKKVGGELKYYIRHGGNIPDKEQKEDGVPMELWSCPQGNYVSFQQSNYKPREGEASFDWLEDALEEEEDEDDT